MDQNPKMLMIRLSLTLQDPNAKILRELREEVERLRQLNETHALQNEAYQQAMDQIARRHQEDKRKALEQQFEQFTQYIRELTCMQASWHAEKAFRRGRKCKKLWGKIKSFVRNLGAIDF